jgi:RNA polymerase sigma factor (sigma-70 family)
MANSRTSEFLQQLGRTTALRGAAGLTDGQMLHAFVTRREDEALTALVRRHGAMVWGVCRRVLRHYHDAEDAFQATFLVLVRKAASIAAPELLANWLYGVAYQTARKARATSATRTARERQVAEMPEPAAVEPDPWPHLQPLLDQELSRLPAKYRSVVVLCDLQGKTRKEAARQLACPDGTVAGRLARARRMLAQRLARRGVALSGGLLGTVLSQQGARAGTPAPVLSATLDAVRLFATGRSATRLLSPTVLGLADGVLRTMRFTNIKMALVWLCVAAVLGFGGGALVWRDRAAGMNLPARPGQDAGGPGKKQPAPPPLEDPKVVAAIEAAGGEVSFWKEGQRRWTKVEFPLDKGTDASLRHLTGLRHLQTLNLVSGPVSLPGRQFTDAGLAHLRDVKTIRTVNFLLLGRVSDTGLAHLKGWTALETINFADMPITGTGLEHLKGLPLKRIWIATGAAVSPHFTDAGLAQVKGFPKLEDLSLISPDITDAGLEHLRGLALLRYLTLGSDRVTDKGLAHLEPLAKGKLEHLAILCPGVTDAGLEHLKGMTRLKDLNLSSTRVTDAGLRELRALTQLSGLTLSGTRIGGAGLAHLKALSGTLEYLDLQKTNLTDAGLAQLHGFGKLRQLNLTDTAVTDAGVEKLQKVLPQVKVTR